MIVAFNLPVVVVKKQVVVSAEQYAVGQVSFAVVACPLVDVMGFGPAGGSVASGPQAATVPDRKGNLLSGAEQAGFATKVDNVAVLTKRDGNGS